MSIDEFIALLEKHAPEANWCLMDDEGQAQCIRVVGGCDCPQTFLSNHETVPVKLWAKVWNAADNMPGHDPALRTRLLAAVGLERKET